MIRGNISMEKAKRELPEAEFYSILSWLREKGYNNLTKVGNDKYIRDIFITGSQLDEFLREQANILHGRGSDLEAEVLWGQTKEHYAINKRGKSR